MPQPHRAGRKGADKGIIGAMNVGSAGYNAPGRKTKSVVCIAP